MTGALVRALPVRPLALHVGAAVALVVMSRPALDDGAVLVLRGVAVLLAAAVALAADEPSAALLDATPVPMRRRLAQRSAVVLALALPVWVLAVCMAAAAGGEVPVAALSLELAALVSLGLAVPLCLRRWWRVAEPAVVAGPVLLGGLLAAAHLPSDLVLLTGSPQEPAWEAAHVRWGLLLVAATALLALATREPATARVSPVVAAGRLGLRART